MARAGQALSSDREPMEPREARSLPLGAPSTLTHRVPGRPPNEALPWNTVLSASPAAFSHKVGFERGWGRGCFFSSEEAS